MTTTWIKALLVSTLVMVSLFAQAQELDFDQLIPMDRKATTFKDMLVQLAWLNAPNNKILEQEKIVADQDVQLSKKSWTELLRANIGIVPGGGEFVPLIDSTDMANPVIRGGTFQPGLSYGVTLDLGFLFTTGHEVKKAKAIAQIVDWNENAEKLKIRAETEKRYEEYLLAIEVLRARQKAENDAEAVYQYFSTLFKNGDGDFQDFNSASESYHSSVEARINADTDIMLAKIALEEMIGISFEQAEKLRKGRK